MLSRLWTPETVTRCARQAGAACQNALPNCWEYLRCTTSVTKLICIVVACVVVILGVAVEGFGQSISDRNEPLKQGAPLQCEPELERLSYTIEQYLGDREAQRKTLVGDFAKALNSALPSAPCDTHAVRSVLMRNAFIRRTTGIMSNRSEFDVRFENDRLLIGLMWSGIRRTFIKEGTFGRVKFLARDFR